MILLLLQLLYLFLQLGGIHGVLLTSLQLLMVDLELSLEILVLIIVRLDLVVHHEVLWDRDGHQKLSQVGSLLTFRQSICEITTTS